MRTAIALLLLAACSTAAAVPDHDLKAAFAKAQKKGAIAVYEERCGSGSTMYLPDSVAGSIAQIAAAMAAQALSENTVPANPPGCAAGMREGDSRLVELYPDGSIKAR